MAGRRRAGASPELEECRTRFRQIANILTFPDPRITADGLVALRAKERVAFGGTHWPASELDPEESRTWHRVLFRNNSLDKMSKPVENGRRLELLLREFRLVDFDFLDTEKPYDLPSWNLRLEEIRDYLLGKRRKNLVYLGTPAEAVRNLQKICRGATVVYNTVFTRSIPESSHYGTVGSEVEAAKRELLATTNCHWQDIVFKSERKQFEAMRNRIEPIEVRERNQYRILEHELPLLQCLVFKRGDEAGAALIGWMFLGSSTEGRVYFSEHDKTVEFFFDYCHHLYWNVAKNPADVSTA